MLIAFHKPYGVISQFTGDGSPNRTLAEFGFPKNVYPIGRLDADSEGLLLLSDEPKWNERLLHPCHAHEREYWAQVERIPTPEALKKLATRCFNCRWWARLPQHRRHRVQGPAHHALPRVDFGAATGGNPRTRSGVSAERR